MSDFIIIKSMTVDGQHIELINNLHCEQRKCLDVNTVELQGGTKRKRFFKRLRGLFSITPK